MPPPPPTTDAIGTKRISCQRSRSQQQLLVSSAPIFAFKCRVVHVFEDSVLFTFKWAVPVNRLGCGATSVKAIQPVEHYNSHATNLALDYTGYPVARRRGISFGSWHCRLTKVSRDTFVYLGICGICHGQGGAIPFKTLREIAKSPKSELGAFLTNWGRF